jgi:hypothetical protein
VQSNKKFTHQLSSKAFPLFTKKNEDVGVDLPPKISKSNEWMARWQEQEDGAMRNFCIIELA